jgi:hypothetical protein
MKAARPFYQLLIVGIGATAGVFLVVGSILDLILKADTLISPPVRYIGTIILVVGATATHLILRSWPLSLGIDRKQSRIKGLGITGLLIVLASLVLLWLPRAAQLVQPPDRATIDWIELLWSGMALTVDVGELPEPARGSLVVEGRSYTVWYLRGPCLWQSTGPAQLPSRMGGEIVEKHYNIAGVSIGPTAHLNKIESATATSECHSPRDRKMVLHGLAVDIDRYGYLSFGGSQHRIAALRPPGKWFWSR